MTTRATNRDLAACALHALARRLWIACWAYHNWIEAYSLIPEVRE